MTTFNYIKKITFALMLSTIIAVGITTEGYSADKVKLRLATSASETGTRAIGLKTVFAKQVSGVAEFEPHWNSTLFKQGTEVEAISRGNLEMTLASAQELAVFFPEFSIFATGYVHRDADHQIAVFKNRLMDPSLWILSRKKLKKS